MSSIDLTSKRTIKDLKDNDIKDQRIVIRVDFNVPIKDNKIQDDTRIRESLPTIIYFLERNPKYILLLSHRGRPDGQKNKKFTLQPLVERVNELLQQNNINDKISFIDGVIEPNVKQTLDSNKSKLYLAENVRFYIEEEGKGKNSEGKKVKADKEAINKFRSTLSSYGDIFVNDAFGTSHRAHSSVVGIKTKNNISVAGLLLMKELDSFHNILSLRDNNDQSNKRPYTAILGGAKVTDKIPVIHSLLDRVNILIIGGGMAFTFKKVIDNMKIGKSLYDEKGSKEVHNIINKAKKNNVKIVLPVDFITSEQFPKGKEYNGKCVTVTDTQGIPNDYIGLDVGPYSVINFAKYIWHSKTIVFNGPMGVFEYSQFANGTIGVLHAIAAATQLNKAFSVLGGGDSVSAAQQFKVAPFLSHLSTGGGASLELLEGKVLPGIASLSDKQQHSKL